MHLQREISAIYPEGETSSMIQIIMEHCGFPSPAYLLEPRREPGPQIIAQINEIVTDIHTRRPIQYILGYSTFCELKLLVKEKILIPRPETEEMIYLIGANSERNFSSILDLGTGSGCIALALKKKYPQASVTGLDLSGPALDLAAENGAVNTLDVKWIQADMLDPSTVGMFDEFDLVVSNPPYVLEEEKAFMDRNVLEFEPPEALFVENHDPLIYYRAIASLAKSSLSEEGELWVEINERFGTETARLLKLAGFTNILIYKDIHGKERFIQARR
ncbi:MAG: peptide chain release factor N(5)-glutamine methyltransferase [Bacteroidota bacterium]